MRSPLVPALPVPELPVLCWPQGPGTRLLPPAASKLSCAGETATGVGLFRLRCGGQASSAPTEHISHHCSKVLSLKCGVLTWPSPLPPGFPSVPGAALLPCPSQLPPNPQRPSPRAKGRDLAQMPLCLLPQHHSAPEGRSTDSQPGSCSPRAVLCLHALTLFITTSFLQSRALRAQGFCRSDVVEEGGSVSQGDLTSDLLVSSYETLGQFLNSEFCHLENKPESTDATGLL